MARNQKLAATVTIGSVLSKSVKKNIGVLRSGLESVGAEIKSVTARQRELSKQRKVLEQQGRSVAELDREYEALGRTLVDLEAKQKRWERAAVASQQVGQRFSSMRREVGRFARNVTVAGVAAGTAIFGLANSTASLGDEVAKTADRLGLSIKGFQELRYVAERSGVSITDFDKGMEGFTRRLGQAADGSGSAMKAFKKLGLDVEEMLALEPEVALEHIADAMAGLETQAERAAVSQDLFGRAGLAMLAMLGIGSEGIRGLRDEGDKTGSMLSEKAARDAEVFKDRLLDTQMVVGGLKNLVGAELMPVVSSAMFEFSEFMKTNREDVKRFAKSFAEGLERAIPIVGDVVGGVAKMAGQVGRVISKVAEMVGGWQNFGLIVGGIFAGKAMLSIVGFVASVFKLGAAMWGLMPALPLVAGGIKAIGLALVANPIGLAVAAIGGAAYLIYRNWEDVGPWFKSLWGDVQGFFGGAAEFIGGVFRGDMRSAVDGLKSMWTSYSDFSERLWQGIGAVLTATYQKVIKPVLDWLGITEPIEKAWSWLGDKLETVVEAIGAGLTWLWENAAEPLLSGLESGVDGVGAAWETMKSALGAVVDWLGEKFEWLMGKLEPVITALTWVRDKGKAIGQSIGLVEKGSVMDDPDAVRRAQESGPINVPNAYRPGAVGGGSVLDQFGKPQARAVGGSYQRGWRMVGEKGAELEYQSQGGFIAHNRALERLAGLSDRAQSGLASAASGVADAAAQVVQNITINAAGLSAAQVADEIERRGRSASSTALYDRAGGYGQYGSL